MPRRLFSVASALALMLCAATIVLWVRSYWRMDSLEYLIGHKVYLAECSAGEVTVLCSTARWRFTEIGRGEFHLVHGFQMFDYTGQIPTRLGFGHRKIRFVLESGDTTPNMTIALFAFPVALPVALLLMTPAGWCAGRIRRSPRAGRGKCTTCGYDLRASKDRCPECGTPINVKIGNAR